MTTAKGTSEYWKDQWGIKNFGGVGEYTLEDGSTVTITKAEKVPVPKDFEDKKAHLSVLKYGYGQMFHGVFSPTELKMPEPTHPCQMSKCSDECLILCECPNGVNYALKRPDLLSVCYSCKHEMPSREIATEPVIDKYHRGGFHRTQICEGLYTTWRHRCPKCGEDMIPYHKVPND